MVTLIVSFIVIFGIGVGIGFAVGRIKNAKKLETIRLDLDRMVGAGSDEVKKIAAALRAKLKTGKKAL
jgi:predicted transporter